MCYIGCELDDECNSGYACVSDPFGFTACRLEGVDISCSDTCSGALEGFTCVGGACAPVCSEGDDAQCEALTGVGSVCVTMDDGTGQKLSICDDSAVSTVGASAGGKQLGVSCFYLLFVLRGKRETRTCLRVCVL